MATKAKHMKPEGLTEGGKSRVKDQMHSASNGIRMAAMIQMLRARARAMFIQTNKSQRRHGKSDGHYY